MIKAFIFDSDGVILNSEPAYMHNNMMYMDEVGIPYNYDVIKSHIGTHENIQIDYFYENHPKKLSWDEVKTEWCRFLDDHPLKIKEIVNPHIEDTVDYLCKQGYKVAIASNSSEELVRECAETANVLKYMEFVMSGLGMSKPKPEPDIYLMAAERLGVKPEECVVIEDSTAGIESGKRAGMTVIALVEHEYGCDQTKADYRIDDLIEICDIEKNLRGTK